MNTTCLAILTIHILFVLSGKYNKRNFSTEIIPNKAKEKY